MTKELIIRLLKEIGIYHSFLYNIKHYFNTLNYDVHMPSAAPKDRNVTFDYMVNEALKWKCEERLIGAAFSWSHTYEGAYFWYEKSQKYKVKIKRIKEYYKEEEERDKRFIRRYYDE